MLRLFKNQKGANLVEYALLAGLIAVAAIASMQALRGKIDTAFSNIGDELDSAYSKTETEPEPETGD